jgi:HEAT repeat protein/energy-coupling factor transporter ATP-binding protein EcfA2
MSDFDFQPYRDFILLDGDKQRGLYTSTDAWLPLQVSTITQQKQGMEQKKSAPEKMGEQVPVLDGLRKYALAEQREHVILFGRPGSGKSTALQQLRRALAAEGLVPILVQLKNKIPILEAIGNELEKGDLELEPKEIKRLLRNQKLILLLDGINEIPTPDLRQSLDYFREQNSKVPMIFTTRDLAFGGELGIGRRLEMKPLTVLQIQEFVGQRLPEVGGKLLKQLGDRLREIAETPLLLKMLCDVFGATGQIPENKGELFRWFDREYDKFKGFPPVSEDSRRFKSEILQQLAFVMMTGDPSKPTEFWLTIDRGAAEREIEKFLIDRVIDTAAKAKEWLEDLLEHHLLQVAADARQIEFHHQLFQEYYAAEKLLNMFCDGHPNVIETQRFQHFYLNYLKWTEAISLLLSLLQDNLTIEEILISASEVDSILGKKLRRFWISLQKNNKNPALDEQYLKISIPVLFESVTSDDRDTAKTSIETLKYLGDAAIPALIKALHNEDPMNFMAAEALGQMSTEVVTPMLLLAITNENVFVREGAARALGNLDRIMEADFQMEIFDSHIIKHPLASTTSELAINARKALQECLNDEDSDVCSAAAIALGKIGCSEAESALRKILIEHKFSHVRKSAAASLIMLNLDNFIFALSNLRNNNYETPENAKTSFYVTAFTNRILNLELITEFIFNENIKEQIHEFLKKRSSESNIAILNDLLDQSKLKALHSKVLILELILNCFERMLENEGRKDFIEIISIMLSDRYINEELEKKVDESVKKISVDGILKNKEGEHLIRMASQILGDRYLNYFFLRLHYREQVVARFYNSDFSHSLPISLRVNQKHSQTIINAQKVNIIENFDTYIEGDKVVGDKVAGDKYEIKTVGNLNTGTVNITGNQTGETK